MRLLLRQRYFSIRDRYEVKDDANVTRYLASSRLFTFLYELHVEDLATHDQYMAKARFRLFFPRIDISKNGEVIGRIQRRFGWPRRYYTLTTPFGKWEAICSAFGYTVWYGLKGEKASLGTMSKKILAIADTYTIDINEDAHAPFLLLTSMVMDKLHHPKN